MSAPLRIPDAGIRLDSMPTGGREVSLDVAEPERAAIARALGITSVDRLEVELHAVKFQGGIRVTGRLTATVVQPSVITLDPVVQQIDEPVDRVYLPSGDKVFAGPADAEIFVDLDGEDIPDHFEGNEADLSALIVETLSLALDPYPRAPGEDLGGLGRVEPDEDESPFAKLKALKDPPKRP